MIVKVPRVDCHGKEVFFEKISERLFGNPNFQVRLKLELSRMLLIIHVSTIESANVCLLEETDDCVHGDFILTKV